MNLFLWLGIQFVFLVLSLTLAIMTSIALSNAKNYHKSFNNGNEDTPAAKQAEKAVNELGWATAIAWIIFVLYVLFIVGFVVLNLTGVGEALELGEAGAVSEQVLAKEALSASKTAEALSKDDIKGASELKEKEKDLAELVMKHGGSIVKDARKTVHHRTKLAIEEDMKSRLEAERGGLLNYYDTINFQGWFNTTKSATFLGALGGIFLVGILAAMGATDLNHSLNKAINSNLTVTGSQQKSQDIKSGEPYNKNMRTGHHEAAWAASIAIIPGALFLLWTIGNFYYVSTSKKAAEQDVQDETEIIDTLLDEAREEVHKETLLKAKLNKEKTDEKKNIEIKKLDQQHELYMSLIEHGVDPREIKLKELEIMNQQLAEQRSQQEIAAKSSHNPFTIFHKPVGSSTSTNTTSANISPKQQPRSTTSNPINTQKSPPSVTKSTTNVNTTHSATHADTTHSATHAETTHSATHADTTHSATHADTTHGATHADTTHGATHADTTHGATHADTTHGATHGATHADTTHGATHADTTHSHPTSDHSSTSHSVNGSTHVNEVGSKSHSSMS